jgi:hypothetical protein
MLYYGLASDQRNGLGRFPVTLYYEQWIKLLDRAQELHDFLEANNDKEKLKE